MSDGTDRIQREIEIAADAARVWELVSQPGWWINDGRIVQHRIEREGDVSTVHDPVHGAFPIQTVRLEPPRYAAFRWMSLDSRDRSVHDQSTLIEFWITDRPGGGVVLRVIERGFESLDAPEDERRKNLEDNTEGWEVELAAARSFLTGS